MADTDRDALELPASREWYSWMSKCPGNSYREISCVWEISCVRCLEVCQHTRLLISLVFLLSSVETLLIFSPQSVFSSTQLLRFNLVWLFPLDPFYINTLQLVFKAHLARGKDPSQTKQVLCIFVFVVFVSFDVAVIWWSVFISFVLFLSSFNPSPF